MKILKFIYKIEYFSWTAFILNTDFPKQRFNTKICTKNECVTFLKGLFSWRNTLIFKNFEVLYLNNIYFQCLVFIPFLYNFSNSVFLYKKFLNSSKWIFFWPWPGAICQIILSRDPRPLWKVAQLGFLILCTWSLGWNFQILGYLRC